MIASKLVVLVHTRVPALRGRRAMGFGQLELHSKTLERKERKEGRREGRKKERKCISGERFWRQALG